ncbi:MAG: hypothetical protein WBD22_14705 [Pyrinomonadaceae bacterium]
MTIKLSFVIAVSICLTVCLTAGCSSLLKNKDFDASNSGIFEITLSNGGGQMNYWFQIILRKDGTAEYLGDVSPDRRSENRSFGQSTKEIQRVKYRGKLPQAQFEMLVKLINDNHFFSMREDNGGVMDAPQTTTGVVKSGTRKEVHNQLGQGGEKLAKIEHAISRATDQIKWEEELK